VDRQAFALFFAILTVAVQLFVVACVAGAVVRRIRPTGRLAARATAARDLLAPDALWAATIVATVTMLGSLYLSEIADYPPCKLCWLQRIAMYPLSIICGVAAVTRDRAVARYVWPLTAIGALISIYHYQLERFPEQESLTCSVDVPCTTVWIWKFHYISIPLMALSAFAAIACLVAIARSTTDDIADDTADDDLAPEAPTPERTGARA
jgi:disulfide bond formation protein DsbB